MTEFPAWMLDGDFHECDLISIHYLTEYGKIPVR